MMTSISSTSRGRSSKQVERPLETRGVAGSSPADHIAQMFLGSVAQRAERPTLNRRRAGSSPAGVTCWKDCHWCGTPFRKRVGLRALGVRLPLLPPGGMAEWKGSALLTRGRLAAPQVRILLPPPFVPAWSSGKTRDCYSRSAGSIPAAGVADRSPARLREPRSDFTPSWSNWR
jgi:hypothetical protein